MRKYLIPEEGSFYKANLHSHSTVSDGGCTPQRLKEHYKNHGYSILAFTDHELLVDHSDLDDEDFLTITGVEYAFVEKEDYWSSKTIEFNMFAKNQHNVTQVCFDPSYVIHGEKWRADIAKRIGGDFKREYTIECMQKVIDTARENGFLVSLNHPCYSMETPEFFGKLDGLFAMEIYNHTSFVSGGINEYNTAMYDDMLRRGKRLSCLCTDDCHRGNDDDDKQWHHDRYGGFVMIKAPRLEYGCIMDALEKGDFYASQGPEIKSLYIEDDKIHIECSEAKSVSMVASHRPFGGTCFADSDGYVTRASFNMPKHGQQWFRFEVRDEKGYYANTRAYHIDEFEL